MGKKSWERKKCDGCKSYNPECRMCVWHLSIPKAEENSSKRDKSV